MCWDSDYSKPGKYNEKRAKKKPQITKKNGIAIQLYVCLESVMQ